MGNRICKLDPAGLCGTSIDTGNVTFSEAEPNLVYMDKVFSYNSDTSCPVFFCLDTRCDSDDFEIKYTTTDIRCGCGCDTCELDCNAVFEIERAFAVLNFIETSPPGNISPSQVTIDGEEVDSVTFENGRYTVGISDLVSRLQHQQCLEANLPSKNFLSIRNVCAWQIRATYVLEGTVTSGGRTCCFRAEIRNTDDAQSTILPESCCSSFAIPNFSIPCAINGISPELAFHFGGNIKLVNPQLKVKCRNNATLFPILCDTPTLVFKSKVVLEPIVHVESVRRTLFSVDAQEGIIPCQNVAGELESERRTATNPCNNLAGCGFHHSNTCKLSSSFGCRIDTCRSESGSCDDDRSNCQAQCGTGCNGFNPCQSQCSSGSGCGGFNPCRTQCGTGCGGCGVCNACRSQCSAGCNDSNQCGIRDDVCSDNRNPCRIRDDVCEDNRGDSCEEICEEICDIICENFQGECRDDKSRRCNRASESDCRDISRSCTSFGNRACTNPTACRRDCSDQGSNPCVPTARRTACQFFGSNGCSW